MISATPSFCRTGNKWLQAGAVTSDFRLGGDLTIGRLGFGAMRLPAQSGINGTPRDPETSRAVLRRAVELGVNHIDTADFYRSGDGSVRANTLTREALYPYPSDVVIATKVGPVIELDGLRQAEPAELRAAVEANLEALGVDRLDLVYLRIGAMGAPHGESLAERFEALAALREEGLIRHLGISNVNAAHLAEARTIAPVAAVQNNFHVAHREETAVLDTCTADGIAFVPFFPLGGGRTDLSDDRLVKIADRHGAHRLTDRTGLAAGPLPRHTRHPRHRLPRPPGREHGRPRHHPHPGLPRRSEPALLCSPAVTESAFTLEFLRAGRVRPGEPAPFAPRHTGRTTRRPRAGAPGRRGVLTMPRAVPVTAS
jgi:pyridoxine 4-dehydrogenase